MRLWAHSVLALAVTGLVSCGRSYDNQAKFYEAIITDDSLLANNSVQDCIAKYADISSKLTCLPGVKVEQEVFSNIPGGYRRFDLTFNQPIDHRYPEGRKFGQRVILWHRDVAEPMIMHTSGYTIFNEQLYLLATTWQTNQIQVTHRYFRGAEPKESVWDWSKLDIMQSAADFHRIVVALKQVYPRNWVNNGGSKGGMTSVFFRRFYPKDLAGTVADVAPLSFSPEDNRYIDFVDNVGGSELAYCRAKLRSLQRVFLTRRSEFESRMGQGTYSNLGGVDAAFENTIISMPFSFHQYHNVKPKDPVRCDSMPSDTATADVLWTWLVAASSPLQLEDKEVKVFLPYYYQANTELGGETDRTSNLQDLLRYPYIPSQLGPKGVNMVYSEDAMRDVERWVKTKSEGLMFVYGGNDPWSAGMFPYRPEADSYRFVVPKGNHGSKFTDLAPAEQNQFAAILSRWLGKQRPMNLLDELVVTPVEDPQIRL